MVQFCPSVSCIFIDKLYSLTEQYVLNLRILHLFSSFEVKYLFTYKLEIGRPVDSRCE